MQNKNEDQVVAALNRISKILAGLLLHGLAEADQVKKIVHLKGCGFSNTEIAQMLNTTTNTVGVALHSEKRKKSRKSRTAAK